MIEFYKELYALKLGLCFLFDFCYDPTRPCGSMVISQLHGVVIYIYDLQT